MIRLWICAVLGLALVGAAAGSVAASENPEIAALRVKIEQYEAGIAELQEEIVALEQARETADAQELCSFREVHPAL